MKRNWFLLSLTVILALLVSACGEGDFVRGPQPTPWTVLPGAESGLTDDGSAVQDGADSEGAMGSGEQIADTGQDSAGQDSAGQSSAPGERVMVLDQRGLQAENIPVAELERVSDLVGYMIETPSGENVGTVHSLIVEQRTGKILYLVIHVEDDLDLSDPFVLVPWSALVARPDPASNEAGSAPEAYSSPDDSGAAASGRGDDDDDDDNNDDGNSEGEDDQDDEDDGDTGNGSRGGENSNDQENNNQGGSSGSENSGYTSGPVSSGGSETYTADLARQTGDAAGTGSSSGAGTFRLAPEGPGLAKNALVMNFEENILEDGPSFSVREVEAIKTEDGWSSEIDAFWSRWVGPDRLEQAAGREIVRLTRGNYTVTGPTPDGSPAQPSGEGVDAFFDLQTGRVRYAVIRLSHELGSVKGHVLVPFDRLIWESVSGGLLATIQ